MLSRRTFLTHGAALVAGAQFPKAGGAGTIATAIVEVPHGPVRGETSDGIRRFLGVPFAEPPTGPLRFRPPQPAKPWREVRETTRFAPAAVQPGEPSIPQSEDCLYLNIWSPDQKGAGLPVLVWIHGGGFTGGRSSDPLSDGSSFAREGIVCVTIAYRLGVLGFLDVGALLGEEYSGSANNGLRDVMAALQWVQANIAAFGGDPSRVTIGGESAGAKLIDMLMGIPSARPLFQQAISESGGAERIWPRAKAVEVARGLGNLWTSTDHRTLQALQSSPARALIEVQQQFTGDWPVHFPLRAEIDGVLVSEAPIQAIRKGSTKGKRLLLGTNRDESALFLGPHPAQDPTARDLGNLTLEQFDKVAAKYKQLYPAMSEGLRRIRSVTAEEYWIPSMRVADAHVDAGGAAFVYRLDFPSPAGRYSGEAFHSFDLRFVWDRFLDTAPTAEEQGLARSMHSAWSAFIRTGTPQSNSLPAWPQYSPAKRPTMLFDRVSRVEDAPDIQEFEAWNGLLQ
jgi:para-nitrobenzyl esterase